MRRIVFIFTISLLLSGCATLEDTNKTMDTIENLDEVEKEVKEAIVAEAPDQSLELQNIESEELVEAVEEKGVIFAKTAFEGVLKTSYVKLFFESQDDSEEKFQLHIGEKSQQTFPWAVKTVEPGYFFIELPVGIYKISSISIPVGSTMATEELDISLEVLANAVVYIGTLKMVGTKEKIKIGGVPVIKPGFEYTVEILDENQEGIAAFQERYPDVKNEIIKQLMTLNSP